MKPFRSIAVLVLNRKYIDLPRPSSSSEKSVISAVSLIVLVSPSSAEFTAFTAFSDSFAVDTSYILQGSLRLSFKKGFILVLGNYIYDLLINKFKESIVITPIAAVLFSLHKTFAVGIAICSKSSERLCQVIILFA